MSGAHWSLIVLAGVAVGIFVGMVGTSGALLVPTLVLVFGLSQRVAQGTSIIIASIPVWVGPLLPYARAHNVEWRLGLLLGAGICVGGYFGAEIAQVVPIVLLRRTFAVVLVALAVRMFLQR